MKQTAKTTSVSLAIILQLLPVAKQVLTEITDFTPTISIIFRWGIGLSALLGGVDAVSGASTVITSPSTATGTNGVPFSFRLTTGPQVASSYTASPLPPGLILTASSGRITGTPTQSGVTVATVRGCDGGNGCTPNATLTITIVAGGGGGATPPTITSQPGNVTVTAGSSATFSVTAAGTAPLTYQWRYNAANIAGATGSSFSMASAQPANAGTYSVVVSNSAGTVTSANATLTVNPLVVAPSITTQPASQSVTAGSGATFSVVASGTAPLTYQWRFNAANIAGATASSYSLANAQAANAGAYSVVIGNSAGTVTSVNATLTVTPAPVAPSITTQPASQTITAGSGATFNVAAGGTAPLNYQWRFNGANISGATAAAYVLTNAQAANAGSYSVVVSNSAGTVTSVTATLTVNPAPIAPSITTPPASQSVVAGANVSFSVVAAGTGPLTYQWRFNNANIAGATTSTYNLNNCQTANAGNYSCLVSNIAGSVTSAAAVLAVSAAPVAPSITTPPATQTVTAGANVNFTVAASGTAPLFYQWLFNNAPLAGKTSSTLALSNVQAADAGAYSVLVSNSVGSVTSVAATLTVNPAPIAPTITTQPAPQTILAGNSISCSVVATGTGPLTYQWRFNNANIAGATSSTYNLANAQASNAGSYSVIVGNAAGSVTSVTTVVTVNIPPSITMQPATQTVALGANVNFSVTTAGTGPLSYQWSHSGTPIAGATSSALALTGVQTTDSGAYAVTVTSAYGAATSSSATLTVNLPTPPTIAASPASQTVSVGTSVSFTVTASGTGPLSYQWRFNGADIAGSTSATLTIASAQTTAAGSYDVVVNNTAGTATSAAATLTIVAGSPATAGVYQGLFYDTNGVAMASSGYFTVAVAANGSFTAALRAGADRIKFKGMFDAAGRVVATGLGKRKLSVSMQISQEGLTGSVTDGQWIATVQGDRNGFDPASNPAPFAGAYGLVVPQAATLQDAGADTEHDATTGSVTVDVRGGVRFAGTLLNNLKATQTTALSKNGNWPFYVVLPRHQGIAIGWINFDGTAPAVATGTLLWLQPTDPAGGGTEFPVQVRVAHHDD